VVAAFGVVTFSVLVQGLTAGRLFRAHGLDGRRLQLAIALVKTVQSVGGFGKAHFLILAPNAWPRSSFGASRQLWNSGVEGAAIEISATSTVDQAYGVARQSGWEGGDDQECILTVAAD
jgi:NhaP-type Na+/H+ or K+/H+ antiporter